ncbi:hypothetical protein HXX02_04290 [Microbulbifer elongatus]|uniref:Uncharacterized protein n=1 Tax=Microbulbifer elongatus TaxID=86173 RepID=A0ABT1NXV6_9GAMM|nr:hypothetical protein [Microbulbifer elongatus]MCQ3828652.1 hypothetical protein [Microbulbifer elongatus]
MFSNTSNFKRELRIAGANSGKPVTIVEDQEPTYHELVKLARRGNYWAQITVNGIHELTAGRLHQNNIFIKPDALNKGGSEQFVAIFPGCKVTVEKLPSDTYKVLKLEANLQYGELIKTAQKPGLYKAELKGGGEWKVSPHKKAVISNEKNRSVAICDTGYDGPGDAAESASLGLAATPFTGGAIRVNGDGFDMHYTPGEARIGGLRNYRAAIRPLKIDSLHESALLLAGTMYQSRDIQGVGWVAEYGGSAVLTQALRILADRGVKLTKHTAFFYEPTTPPNQALKAAHDVGLKLDRKLSKANFLNVVGNSGQLAVICNRLIREDKTSYTLAKACADTVAHGKSLQGFGSFAGTLAAAAGLSMTSPAAAGAFLTALGAAAAIGGKGLLAAKTANTALEGFAPRLHNRLKSKF